MHFVSSHAALVSVGSLLAEEAAALSATPPSEEEDKAVLMRAFLKMRRVRSCVSAIQSILESKNAFAKTVLTEEVIHIARSMFETDRVPSDWKTAFENNALIQVSSE